MANVTIIGLGGMGTALASCLLGAGYQVTVWNRTASKADSLVKAGATHAPSVSDAIAASSAIISCIRSISDTASLLSDVSEQISGKEFIELSTGNRDEATTLQEFVRANGADCVVGTIAAYPSGIGQNDTAILISGSKEIWESHKAMIQTIGPASVYIGSNVAALAALFSALFLPRQGFMFGMIFGALICEKVGISSKTYFDQIPTAVKVNNDYIRMASETIQSEDYSNRGASVNVYKAAFTEMLATFEQLDVPSDMPDFMFKLIQKAIDAGYGDEELTSLLKVLR